MDVRGQLLQTDSATMYDIARYVIKPFTKQHSCSYAERVSTAPQQPAWVVLHWCHLPNLNYIDLSENKDARNKWDLFDALKLRSERELEAIKLQAASEGRGTPMGVTLRRFTLEAGKEFKVVPINPVRSIDDDD